MRRLLRIHSIELALAAGLAAIVTSPASAQSLSDRLTRQIGEVRKTEAQSGVSSAQSLSDRLTRQIEVARRAESKRDFSSALSMYGDALGVLSAEGDSRRVLRMRAKLLEHLEEYAHAEADLTAALGVAPVDPSLYVDRGYFYMRRLRYADALADFAMGAQLKPTDAIFPFAVGRVENALGRHARAIDNYNRALALDPANGRAMLARAEARFHRGLLRSAWQDYTGSLALSLEHKDDLFFAWLGRGYVAMMLGDLDAAVADFDAALAINPDAFNALSWRGYAHELSGRHDLALADYERAYAYDPEDSTMRDSIRRLRAK